MRIIEPILAWNSLAGLRKKHLMLLMLAMRRSHNHTALRKCDF